MEQQSPLSKNRTLIYNRLHKLTLWGIFGVSVVTTGLLAYNIYLFKRGWYIFIDLFEGNFSGYLVWFGIRINQI